MEATQSQTSISESPVKHTAAGEIPDTSTIGRIARRAQADLPALKAWLSVRSNRLAVVSAIAVLGGGIFARRWWLARR